MLKRIANLFQADHRRRWGAVVVATSLVWSGPMATAQSLLRFVGPDNAPAEAAVSLPQPSVASNVPMPPSGSEFRFVELSEGKVSPLPQFSVSSREMKAGEQSTLKFAPTAHEQSHAAALTDARATDFVEMRFKPLAVPTGPIAAPAPSTVTVRATAPVSQSETSTQKFASELFAKPPMSENAPFKPRIAMAVEHVPASVPQHIEAQPVRSARELSPAYAAPVGTELFGSSAPTVAANVPKQWNLPALDYGSALQQVRPAQPPTLSAQPIEPKRVAARELPSSAAGMFALGAPEPLIVVQPVERPMPVVHPPVAEAPVVVEHKPIAQPQSPAKVAAPQVIATTKPVATPVVAARVKAPVDEQRRAAVVAKQPAAADLDFSNVPLVQQPQKQHFAAAAPARSASSSPVSDQPIQERLVPASVTTPSQTNLVPAYQPGNLAGESHVADYKPVNANPPAAQAPERSQVVATVDPQDPNTYTLSYGSTNTQPPAMYVSSMEPTAAESMQPAAEPVDTMPLPCNCGRDAYGQYGCPYLPGQSGTRSLCGVDCGRCGAACNSSWGDATCIPWALLGPGEYIGPARPAHVETYYLRVNDVITLTFIESRKKSAEHYRIGVGDRLQIEWLQGAANAEFPLNRELLVQPDGTVTLPLIGEVNASGKTINDFRDEVIKFYSKFQREPQITITPLTVNVAVQDVLKAVTAKNQSSGQTQDVKVTPEGTIQSAGIGSVYAQGLTLDELRNELEARYAQAYGPGLTVSPQLTERATSYVFIGGEVKSPGRYVLEGPTTVMQAVQMAGSWNNGGNLRQIVIFRRDENWCLKATKIDVRGAFYGKDPCPLNDVWLRDNDLVIVPKSCILCATDLINLYFTRGIYAVFPISYVYDFSQNSGIVPVP